jgi:hypothetical protein
MRKVLFVASILLLTTASAVAAGDLKRMQLASSLGDLLASEKPCGLSYDQAAIDKFIDANVPAGDMEFTSTLTMMTEGQKAQIGEMSKSELHAHCRQIGRVAKHYHFVGE